MAEQQDERLPFRIRGSLQTLLALQLIDPDHPRLLPELEAKLAHAGQFYRDAPLLLDLAAVRARPPIDLARLVGDLRRLGLHPVGVQNPSPPWREAAEQAGLAIFGPGTQPPERRAHTPRGRSAMVVDRPVRGGEQIVAREGDLVVLGPVGHGAEIAASGHVHVYAPLRGRAFAGIDGDPAAMIFCDRLEAELVSIAGVYLVAEEFEPAVSGARVHIRRRGEALVITPCGA